MSTLSEELTTEEQQLYEQCKAQIRGGFIAIAQALLSIRDRRLYRKEFSSFDEFCKTELKRADRNWADRQITALETVQILESAEVEILPDSAAQVRALNNYSPDQKVEVWNLACSLAGGIPSSRLVERVDRHVRSTLPRGSAVYQPGQAVSVKDEKCAHYGKLGVIERISGVILYTQINGQVVPLLPSEVEELKPDVNRPRPAQSSPLLEARLSVAEFRLQKMEAVLGRVLAIARQSLPDDLVQEAHRLIS